MLKRKPLAGYQIRQLKKSVYTTLVQVFAESLKLPNGGPHPRYLRSLGKTADDAIAALFYLVDKVPLEKAFYPDRIDISAEAVVVHYPDLFNDDTLQGGQYLFDQSADRLRQMGWDGSSYGWILAISSQLAKRESTIDEVIGSKTQFGGRIFPEK
jgi:hypothetical protein